VHKHTSKNNRGREGVELQVLKPAGAPAAPAVPAVPVLFGQERVPVFLLGLGRCQSVHFSAQIAIFTLKYNILCTVKRFEAYETLGILFAQAASDTLELSVTDKIWKLLLEIIMTYRRLSLPMPVSCSLPSSIGIKSFLEYTK